MVLIYCHLIGDFLLQNEWMQRKGRSSFVCLVHVFFYSLPFWFCSIISIPRHAAWLVFPIMAEHFLQDRFDWAGKYQHLIRQTPAEKWPVGRLIVDQVFHLLWIEIVVAFFAAYFGGKI
jgi:hypothetical protein